MMAFIVEIVPMVKLNLLCHISQGWGRLGQGQEQERMKRRIPISYAPAWDDWYRGWYEDWNWDVSTVDFAATTISKETITETSSLGVQCPITPSLIGSIMGPLPQNHSCYSRINTRTTTIVTPCGHTQIWNTAAVVPPSIAAEKTSVSATMSHPPLKLMEIKNPPNRTYVVAETTVRTNLQGQYHRRWYIVEG